MIGNGYLLVLDHIKNSGEITIDGYVQVNSKIEGHGHLEATGTIITNAGLNARTLPSLAFSAEGPDFKVYAPAVQVLDPGAYGRVEVKKGASLQFTG